MENLVLYRKYRPQTFAEVVGQEHVVTTLKNSLAQNKIAHAYLFAGPRGSGKTTLARLLAKSLNCEQRTFVPSNIGRVEPCNKCSNCSDFSSARSLDLIEIDAASNRGIDEIKNLRENVRFGPSAGRYKVYLIDEVHMLTKEAFNAFLKTLEEPPTHAVFILATTEAHRLPATIISRTQRFDFKRLSPAELVTRLSSIAQKEKILYEPEALKLVALEADGSARDAEGMLGQLIASGQTKITLSETEEILGLFSHRKIKDFVSLILSNDRVGTLNWLHKTVDTGYDINQLIKSLNHYIRKLVMTGISPELAKLVKSEMSEDDFKALETLSQKSSPVQLAGWLKIFGEAHKKADHYPLPQMALEMALINLLDPQDQTLKAIPKSDFNAEEKTVAKLPGYPITNVADTANKNVLDAVLARWNDVIVEVRPHNHSLSGFLMGMKPKEVTATSLTLATKYSFHKDRLSEIKNKKIIEDAVHKILGRRLSLNCVLEK